VKVFYAGVVVKHSSAAQHRFCTDYPDGAPTPGGQRLPLRYFSGVDAPDDRRNWFKRFNRLQLLGECPQIDKQAAALPEY